MHCAVLLRCNHGSSRLRAPMDLELQSRRRKHGLGRVYRKTAAHGPVMSASQSHQGWEGIVVIFLRFQTFFVLAN